MKTTLSSHNLYAEDLVQTHTGYMSDLLGALLVDFVFSWCPPLTPLVSKISPPSFMQASAGLSSVWLWISTSAFLMTIGLDTMCHSKVILLFEVVFASSWVSGLSNLWFLSIQTVSDMESVSRGVSLELDQSLVYQSYNFCSVLPQHISHEGHGVEQRVWGWVDVLVPLLRSCLAIENGQFRIHKSY